MSGICTPARAGCTLVATSPGRTVRPVRRVDIGTGIEEQRRDVNHVLRRLLTKVLDAVGRDILQKSRLMVARGPRAYQRGIRTEEAPQSSDVAGDDGLRRRF